MFYLLPLSGLAAWHRDEVWKVKAYCISISRVKIPFPLSRFRPPTFRNLVTWHFLFQARLIATYSQDELWHLLILKYKWMYSGQTLTFINPNVRRADSSLKQGPPTFLAPGPGLVEDNCSMVGGGDKGDWRRSSGGDVIDTCASSCCVAGFPTGHGLVPVRGLEGWGPLA